MKYLGTNLTKDMQYPYIEDSKILLREIREDLNKWRYILCLWIRWFSIASRSTPPNWYNNSTQSLPKAPQAFL